LCDLVIMGLGHAGLPLARRACEAGLSVVGYDISTEVVAGLNAGRSHIGDVPDEALADMVSAGFTAVDDPGVIGRADTVVICVPTGLDERGAPDLGAVRAATRAVAAQLRPGMLVVLESTSYPGTTEEIVRPLLESGSGLRVGPDFHLAFSPERIDPGNRRYGIRNTPKVIGGCTPLCAKYAVTFYGRFVDSVVVSRGTREAEMAKLLENAYRYVNIALVDEIALYCERVGIDVWDVLHCAATKPFGYAPFRPGPGIGGHCVPIDPMYLAAKAEQGGHAFRMLSAAQQVHEYMPRSVADRAMALLARSGIPARGARMVLLGVTYKADVADTRRTPAEPIVRELRGRGASVSYHDPHVGSFAVDGIPVPAMSSLSMLSDVDVAVLLQDHSCFDPARLVTAGCLVLDTRGSLPAVAGERPEPRISQVTRRVGLDPAERTSEAEFLSITEDLIYAEGEAAANRLLRPLVEAVIGLGGSDRISAPQFTCWLAGLGVDQADALAAFHKIGRGDALSAAQVLAAIREFRFGRLEVELLA
jgi:UDP-N-acetyl-D-glucosamine dehydrogenase